MRGCLGTPVAGEHAVEVHCHGSRGALAGFEIREVPHVHPFHEGPLGREVKKRAQELDLILPPSTFRAACGSARESVPKQTAPPDVRAWRSAVCIKLRRFSVDVLFGVARKPREILERR